MDGSSQKPEVMAPVREIPIRNLFCMLAYAWDQSRLLHAVEVGRDDNAPDAANFFGKVLVGGCRQLFRRGLDRTYRPLVERLNGLRGKVQVGPTLRGDYLRRGQTICEFDELSFDALHNQLLKATLQRLLVGSDLSKAVSETVRGVIREFNAYGVSDIRPTRQAFRQVQLHRNNAFYSFLLNTAELALADLFPDEGGRGRAFADILDDEKLNVLFETFLRNFYRAEQAVFAVHESAQRVEWDLSVPTANFDATVLPGMYPDIVMRSPARTIVIDAKYYRKPLASTQYGPRLHSANLYQMYAYLKNIERKGGADERAEGILLYPRIDQELALRYDLPGHTLRVCTINLNQPWSQIETDLLQLIDL